MGDFVVALAALPFVLLFLLIGRKIALEQRGEQSPNQRFLQVVRSRSCYPVLRGAHAVLTFVAVIGTCIMWIMLMNNARGEAGIYPTFLCGAVIVALLIEYGLFRLIVDAVDVLIVMGQHTAANNQGGTAPGAGG